jgi:hypothetical protein
MAKRIFGLTAAAAAGAVFVGCGSGGASSTTTTTAMSGQQFTQFLHGLSKSEQQAQQAVGQGLHSQSVGAMQNVLTRFAADQASIADRLSSVTPPQDAESATSELEKGFADNASGIRQLMPRIANAGTTGAVLQLLNTAKGPQQAGHEIDDAIAKLKKLGYTKGS